VWCCCNAGAGRSDENTKKTRVHLLGTVPDDIPLLFVTRVLYTDLCSQTAKLKLLCEERRRLRKARSDVTLVGNRTSEVVSRQLRSDERGRPCLHNKSIFNEAIYV
jgi:hypothetical protein